MADSILSITIRDTNHPCAPYQSTRHTFSVEIFHCDGTPLNWKGNNLALFPLSVKGVVQPGGVPGGGIHDQIKVPPGCYLIRAIAECKNVVTDWAWVDVGCNETACVNLISPNVIDCINRVMVGLQLGTIDPPQTGEETVAEKMPKEVRDAVDALRKVADKLPREGNLPPVPSVDEIKRAVRQGKK